MTTDTKRVWTEAEIVSLLNRNQLAVERAIIALYQKGQTADEQVALTTTHDNKVGFSAADARRCSFVADFLIRNPQKHLTAAKLPRYRAVAIKYRKQLLAMANSPS